MAKLCKEILQHSNYRKVRNQFTMKRTKPPKKKKISESDLVIALLQNPGVAQRELNNRSFFEFFLYFWDVISSEKLVANWHIEYLCNELQEAAEGVGRGEAKWKDIVINIPPGTSKTSIISIMFPVWCWTKWYWMRLITASYSASLSLESAESARDLIRSDQFTALYPELQIKADKDTKSNYRIEKRAKKDGRDVVLRGGNRFTTSVGGALTGYHGHILIVDDPLNPYESTSNQILHTTNYWVDNVLSTRKVDKEVTLTIILMQRLHQNDPSGHLLAKKAGSIHHICLPGDLKTGLQYLKPKELKTYYKNDLLDPIRLSRKSLLELEQDLGQYGYAGQMDQNPVPPGGGMFKVDKIATIDQMPMPHEIDKQVRAWDKAGTKNGGAFTAGLRMLKFKAGEYAGKYLIVDCRRGQLGTDGRENLIKRTAEADARKVKIVIEQEPGSGGKESAEATIKNLAGFSVKRELPKGDKIYRADPFSVQVNWGNVLMLRGDWNDEFINELRFFPLGKYKDQVDAGSMAFAYLTGKRKAK